MNAADFQERREALANDDLNGRADLMTEDAALAMLRTLIDEPSEDEVRELTPFSDVLVRELRSRLRAEKEFIFLTEILPRAEMREAVEVACDASCRAMVGALDAAQSAHPLPARLADTFAALRRRAGLEGMDTPEMVAEREAWLDGLPTCAGCGE